MPKAKVKQEEFSVIPWYSTIPLTDDVYLGMQAQNIAIVDTAVIRVLEAQALEQFYGDEDRVSPETASLLSALSQMWVFALYEFLRTWRQRARTLLLFAEKLAALTTDAERDTYMKEINDYAQERSICTFLARRQRVNVANCCENLLIATVVL